MEGEVLYSGSPTATSELILDNAYERLRDEFDLNAHCRANFGSFELDAQAHVVAETKAQ